MAFLSFKHTCTLPIYDPPPHHFFFFFLIDPPPTEIYPLPLPDLLPIAARPPAGLAPLPPLLPGDLPPLVEPELARALARLLEGGGETLVACGSIYLGLAAPLEQARDRKSTRLNSSPT